MSIADWAQVLSGLGAAAAATFAALQLRESRRIAVVASLQQYYQAVLLAERALHTDDAAAKERALFEYLNLLELYAALYRSNSFSGKSKELVGDHLVDALVELVLADHWNATIEEALTSESALRELREFMTEHRAVIVARTDARKKLQAL